MIDSAQPGAVPSATSSSRSVVTGIVTSCNRHDLLDRALGSFFATNTYPLQRIIVVEDGERIAVELQEKYKSESIEWISTGRRVGQIAAVDYVYSRVTTPYIFHFEDDWEFHQAEFIEESLQIMKRHRKCLQVWIRSVHDTSGHPLQPRTYKVKGARWQKLELDYAGMWHGFSFNPGLRRLADYIAIGGYGNCAKFDFRRANKAEAAIGHVYRDQGFFAAILVDAHRRGYAKHVGSNRHVGPPNR